MAYEPDQVAGYSALPTTSAPGPMSLLLETRLSSVLDSTESRVIDLEHIETQWARHGGNKILKRGEDSIFQNVAADREF
jgi:hypothetical protein